MSGLLQPFLCLVTDLLGIDSLLWSVLSLRCGFMPASHYHPSRLAELVQLEGFGCGKTPAANLWVCLPHLFIRSIEVESSGFLANCGWGPDVVSILFDFMSHLNINQVKSLSNLDVLSSRCGTIDRDCDRDLCSVHFHCHGEMVV